jgi:hypothetical protein
MWSRLRSRIAWPSADGKNISWQLEVNIYRGSVFNPESGNWQRTFGGHVAGQSLVSAVRTVDPHYLVHSLHGYFIRPDRVVSPYRNPAPAAPPTRQYC